MHREQYGNIHMEINKVSPPSV